MITKEQIQERAIFEQNLLIESRVEPLFSAGVRAGFEIGTKWAIDWMQAENEKLHAALKVIFDADENELRGEMWYAETVNEAIEKAKNLLK